MAPASYIYQLPTTNILKSIIQSLTTVTVHVTTCTTVIASARAIAVHTPALTITRTTGKTLTVARRAHWATALEETARLNTIQDTTRVAKVCLHATCAALPCIRSTARLCVTTLTL